MLSAQVFSRAVTECLSGSCSSLEVMHRCTDCRKGLASAIEQWVLSTVPPSAQPALCNLVWAPALKGTELASGALLSLGYLGGHRPRTAGGCQALQAPCHGALQHAWTWSPGLSLRDSLRALDLVLCVPGLSPHGDSSMKPSASLRAMSPRWVPLSQAPVGPPGRPCRGPQGPLEQLGLGLLTLTYGTWMP